MSLPSHPVTDRSARRGDGTPDAAATSSDRAGGTGAWPADARGVLGGASLAGALERWAAEAAVDDAAAARARERWLRQQADEGASLAGTLLDLAERGDPVVVEVAGTRLRGVVEGLGEDFAALRTEHGTAALVRLDAVELVRGQPGAADVLGDRVAVVATSLAGVLVVVAGERPDVAVRTRSGTVVRGGLRRVGTDVATLRPEGDDRSPVTVALGAAAIVLLDP